MKPHERLRRSDREAWDRETRNLKPLRNAGRARRSAQDDRSNPVMPAKRSDLEQDEAWIEFTREAVPLEKRSPKEHPEILHDRDDAVDYSGSGTEASARQARSTGSATPGTYSLDRRTRDRLKRGRIEPEARLDLHGMRYVDAKRAVARFLEQRHRQGNRLVLVITGRGSAKLVGTTETDTGYSVPERPESGVLRRDFPHWVREGNLAGIVIDCQQAHVSHGGRGAFYVYLKKRRSGD